MKNLFLAALFALLAGCATGDCRTGGNPPCPQPQDFTKESWLSYMNPHPKTPPNRLPVQARRKTSPFTQVNINGNFRVWIYRQAHDSVYVVGPPHADTSQAITEVRDNTLYIYTCTDCSMEHLTIYIGMRNLHDLTVFGDADVDVSGCLGPNSVTHIGDGTINIVGADSRSLQVTAGKNGLTKIIGRLNLNCVTAYNNSRVYLYRINGTPASIITRDNADVGLAGGSVDLTVDAEGHSFFEGRNLLTDTVNVKTRGWSHANVASSGRIFAAALDNSSIYYFAPSNIVTSYTEKNGTVLSGR